MSKSDIRIDLIDQAGARHPYILVNEFSYHGGLLDGARAVAQKRFHGTAQAYYEDDPERGLPE